MALNLKDRSWDFRWAHSNVEEDSSDLKKESEKLEFMACPVEEK